MRTPLTNEELRNPMIEACITAIVDATHIDREALFSSSRIPAVTRARHALIWLLRSVTTLSYAKIGGLLNRDHFSCGHAYRRFKARYDNGMPTREWARRVRRTALYAASGENIKHVP